MGLFNAFSTAFARMSGLRFVLSRAPKAAPGAPSSWVVPYSLIDRVAQADAFFQVAKSGIIANWVEVGMSLYKLEYVRLFLIGLLERSKGLFLLAKTQVGIYKCSGWNITSTLVLLQISQEPQSIGAPAGERVGADEHTRNGRAAVRQRQGLLQDDNCFPRLLIGIQGKSKRQHVAGIVMLYCERAQAGKTEASIPFNFNVGSHALPAGIYRIKYVSPGAILVESQDKRFRAFSVFFEANSRSSRRGHLVFARYGDRYFLRQVLCGDVDLSVELPTSKLEKRVGMQEARVPRVQTEVATLPSPEK